MQLKTDSEITYPEGFLVGAFEEMRKKLLDISGGRSRLINLDQSRRSVVRIVDELPDELAKILLSEKAMTVVAIPEPTSELLIEHGYIEWDEEAERYISLKKDPDPREWAKILGLMCDYDLPTSSDHTDDGRHTDLDVQSLLFEPALNAILKKLATEAKTSIDETGNNILFLSLGFLEWYDQVDGGRKRLAPLYMIPVSIEKKTVKGVSIYKLKYTGEDIIPNLTLREKLELDFGLTLPDITQVDDQERLLLPDEYFAEVGALLARKSNDPNVKQWKVRRYGTLATLSLGKLLMYLDLDPRRWPDNEENLLQHDVVKRFFQDGERVTERMGGNGNGDAYVLDDVAEIHQHFPMIDDADSSQMSVLIDVLKGNSMVVEGPPGTGKSQTITNLIAAAIAQGKTILFVAEKQAALNVVKRRMDKSGLGDFCLDLHSDKAQKRLVLESINERIGNQNEYKHSASDYEVQVQRYERARAELQDYAMMVNNNWKTTGLTIHEILTAATRYAQDVAPLEYKAIAPEGINGDHFNRVQLDEQLERLERFCSYLDIVRKQLPDSENWESHPWYGVENKDLAGMDEKEVLDHLVEWNKRLVSLLEELEGKCLELGIDQSNYQTLSDVDSLLDAWSILPELKGTEHLGALKQIQPSAISMLEAVVQHYQQVAYSYKKAREVFVTELVENLDQLKELEEAIKGLSGLGVSTNVLFDDLVKAVELLEESVKLNRGLATTKGELLLHITEELRSLFPSTKEGFRELALFVELATSLPVQYNGYRENVFDNETLLTVFTEFKHQLDELEEKKGKLALLFDVNDLPSIEKLRAYAGILELSNFFSPLKSSWRKVRASVATFTKANKFDYKQTAQALSDAADWREACSALDDNDRYRNAFGTQFDGVKTDCQRILTLAEWYQRVRQEYGIGFGRRVPLANALFMLSADVLRGIQNLKQNGFTDQVNTFQHNLSQLSDLFKAVPCFSADDVAFDAELNPLQQVLFTIREHLQLSQGVLLDPNILQSDLLKAISGLNTLKAKIAFIDTKAINSRFFNDELKLPISNRGELAEDLTTVTATIDYLKSLYKSKNIQALIEVIINSASTEDANKAIEDGKTLSQFKSVVLSYETKLLSLIGASREQWFKCLGLGVKDSVKRNQLAIESEQWLDGWIKYLYAKERMEVGGFSKLKQYLTDGEHTLEHVQKVMKFATYQCLAYEIYNEQPELAKRSGHEQTALQQQFGKYDDQLKNLQRKRVASLASERNVPPGTSGAKVASYTEDYLLRHEIKKKSRNISIRNLVTRAGRAMQGYKPCFMMSPMAVAKYIPPGSLKFDLVIMDEASQVKPEYALSSFARGKNIVVVGDPKQLPPTSFFERSMSNDGDAWEDDDKGVIGESESILDAVAGQFPNRQLRWHYRSRHESLIEFSNHRFYDSNLVVFPSPWSASDDYGIKFNYVENGRFLNSVNAHESLAVVAAIREHLINRPNESLGVVAMNSKQRDQIEADLETALSSDAILRAAYDKNLQVEDPLFIKNLENVQGDERDVIFISFTYGPQEKGSTHVPQRFGPINGASGWRRLNVLFTRSKKRIQVYSSMTSNQIVLSETSSLGVKSLKGYLDFAQHGRLIGQTGVKEGEPDSDFEIAVMDALAKEGFECVPQVGVAGFYIDVAVRDPGMPGRYLMGIECDGATYHSSKSTRDRDRVRQSVLEGLDWRIRRIWSTDWFKHPQGELKPIIEELRRLSTPITEAVQLAVDTQVLDEPEAVGEHHYVASAAKTLEDRLFEFAINVIAKTHPDTAAEQRLLRPEMLERLVSEMPINHEDFAVLIPRYLRSHTCTKEAAIYLDEVLEIIADFEEQSPRTHLPNIKCNGLTDTLVMS